MIALTKPTDRTYSEDRLINADNTVCFDKKSDQIRVVREISKLFFSILGDKFSGKCLIFQ
jgi:hypothetical protein